MKSSLNIFFQKVLPVSLLFSGVAFGQIQNSGFESNSLDGWQASGSGTVSVTDSSVHSGSYAALLDGHSELVQTITGLIPNTDYTFEGYVKCGTSTRLKVGIKSFGEKDKLRKLNATEYFLFKFEITTGDTNTTAIIYFANDRTTGTVYGDDFSISRELVPPADGAIANPPAGKMWTPVPELTDEFDGNQLDTDKWHDYHPGWAGRIPSNFLGENVSVVDGILHLRSTSRVSNMSEVVDPINVVWVNSAVVSTKQKIAKPGYFYEARMKASDLSMTSSFWFRMGAYSEIDVIEHMGRPSDPAKAFMEYEFSCNTHVYGQQAGPAPIGATYKMETRGRDEYHNYGVWWKDPETLWFYHNGEKVMTVTPSVPFEEDLHMIFDTEVFTWNGLPTIASLDDPDKNAMKVDWVRTWKLVEDTTPVMEEKDVEASPLILRQNYPNPFSRKTTIKYVLPTASNVKLAIYSNRGQLVKVLSNSAQPAGVNSAIWQGENENGTTVASGIYYCRLTVNGKNAMIKILYLR